MDRRRALASVASLTIAAAGITAAVGATTRVFNVAEASPGVGRVSPVDAPTPPSVVEPPVVDVEEIPASDGPVTASEPVVTSTLSRRVSADHDLDGTLTAGREPAGAPPRGRAARRGRLNGVASPSGRGRTHPRHRRRCRHLRVRGRRDGHDEPGLDSRGGRARAGGRGARAAHRARADRPTAPAVDAGDHRAGRRHARADADGTAARHARPAPTPPPTVAVAPTPTPTVATTRPS